MASVFDERVREDDGLLLLTMADEADNTSVYEDLNRCLLDVCVGKTAHEIAEFSGLSISRCEEIRAVVSRMLGYRGGSL